MPLAPPAEADAYLAKNEEIDARRDALRARVRAIEKPYRDRIELALIKSAVLRRHLPGRGQA